MKMVFTLFCREFGNVINRAFLVLIFWVKKLVGAEFTRFCNYEFSGRLGNGEQACKNACDLHEAG